MFVSPWAMTTADALIEELIRLDSAPRRLVVVSSDHVISTRRPTSQGHSRQ